MSDDHSSRPCPMCATTDRLPKRTVRREAHTYEIVQCAQCAFIFVKRTFSDTFRPVQDAPPSVPEKARHRHIKRLCDRVLTSGHGSGRKHRIIEVGAGWGGLAQVFSRDERYQYVGFEPSVSRAAYCRARGFDVREALFQGVESAGKADAVVIDNVLEHVEEPVAMSRRAVETLSEGGLLVIIVPNVNDIRQLHPRWRDRHLWQPHCHINYFSAKHLRRMFQQLGLDFRFFGFEVLGGRGDWRVVPRVVSDKLGVHVLGLNCFGVKPGIR